MATRASCRASACTWTGSSTARTSASRSPSAGPPTAAGGPLALAEIAVDLRQRDPAALGEALARALRRSLADAAGRRSGRRGLARDWAPVRESIIWRFNRLFWQRLAEWEAASGRGFEAALPSGQSDANHPQAVADSVADFWTLLRELDKQGQLPAEIFALEIGVGSGHARGALARPLQGARRGARHRLLPAAALPARRLLAAHARPRAGRRRRAPGPRERRRAGRAQPVQDALVPALQGPVRPPDQRLRQPALRRAGAPRRAALPGRGARVPAARGRGARRGDRRRRRRPTCPRLVERLLEVGPEALGDRERGVAFWRAVWDALRLEERLSGSTTSPRRRCRPGST